MDTLDIKTSDITTSDITALQELKKDRTSKQELKKDRTSKQLSSFLPIADKFLNYGTIDQIETIIGLFNGIGNDFPIVKNWLTKALRDNQICSLHERIIHTLEWGFGWYVIMGNKGTMGDLDKDDIIAFINAGSCSDILSAEDKNKFINQLRYDCPKIIREELIEMGHFPKANGKVKPVEEIKCSAREKVVEIAKEYYENTGAKIYMAAYSIAERRSFHENKICTCYCSCLECWSTVCCND